MIARLSLFGQSYKLDNLDAETLKVALFDALDKAEYEASCLDENHRDFVAVHEKVKRLKQLIDKFES